MTEPPNHNLQETNSAKNRSLRRVWLITTAGVLILAVAAGYLHFSSARPIGTGPAGSVIDKIAFAHAWTTRPVLLVGLGDSVTASFGARRGYGYFERLIANPPDEFPDMREISLSAVFPSLKATNLAVSGSISLELVETELPRLPMADVQTLGWIVITTGGNDLIHNYGRTPPREQAMYGATLEEAKPWIEAFERRLDSMVAGISTRFPGGCHIFLANIYDPTDAIGDIEHAGLPAWPSGPKLLAGYNDAIRRCAEKHPAVHIVDLHGAFLGHGIHCSQFWSKHYDAKDPHYWYYANLEDPNERGYDVIRRLFLNRMMEVAKSL